MDTITARDLQSWKTKVLAMDLAYQRMTRCDPNSGMYCLYRDEYRKAKAACDEMDKYITSCGMIGYEEYVTRLRFQEAMTIRQIVGKLKLDCGEIKSIDKINSILANALAKMGLTRTGAAIRKMTDEEKEARVETVDEEPQEQEEDDECFFDCPRDIYGNPIDEPPPSPITDDEAIIAEIMNETI